MVKQDVAMLGALLGNMGKRRSYIGVVPTFTLAGVEYDYVDAQVEGDLGELRTWEYGKWPRVEAALPLIAGGTVQVHAEAWRWGHGLVLVRWQDDQERFCSTWIPAANVRRMTASEWDIIEYHQCSPELRSVRWGRRLPGFLPE